MLAVATRSKQMRKALLIATGTLALAGCATPQGSELNRLQRARDANAAFQSGDLVNAKRLYRRLAEERRGAEIAHVRLGAIAYRQGERRLAEKHFEQALRANPSYAAAAYNLARLSLEDSIRYLRRYLEHARPGADRDRAISLLSEIEHVAGKP